MNSFFICYKFIEFTLCPVRALKKMALLVLRRVGLCVGQNQMCHLCGWLKLFLKNVRWKKIKIQKRWLLGRLYGGSFVPLLYFYFCRSFLLCRHLGLQVTVKYMRSCGISRLSHFKFTQMFLTSTKFQSTTKPRNYRIYNVMGWFSYFNCLFLSGLHHIDLSLFPLL